MSRQGGFGLSEVLLVLAVLALSLSFGLPALSRLGAEARASAAARDLALRMHALRWKSVSLNTGHGMLFDQDGGGWSWREVRDGNGNGLRTAEVADGTDVVLSGPHRLHHTHRNIDFGFPPGSSVPDIPPRRGSMEAGDDPIRFGPSDLISFTPLGTSSSGTVFLTDGRETVFGVLLYGVTSRVRVWRYRRASGTWSL